MSILSQATPPFASATNGFGFYVALGFLACSSAILLAKGLGLFLKAKEIITMTLLSNIPPGLHPDPWCDRLAVAPRNGTQGRCHRLGRAGVLRHLPTRDGYALFPTLLGFKLTLLRVDATSKAFGYIFTLCAVAAFIFSWHEKSRAENTAALVYIGSALGVVFAGDMITWYVCWELMAIASTFLILARKTEKSLKAAQRYILVHLAGGLVLLTGILLTVHQTGSIAFTSFPRAKSGVGSS